VGGADFGGQAVEALLPAREHAFGAGRVAGNVGEHQDAGVGVVARPEFHRDVVVELAFVSGQVVLVEAEQPRRVEVRDGRLDGLALVVERQPPPDPGLELADREGVPASEPRRVGENGPDPFGGYPEGALKAQRGSAVDFDNGHAGPTFLEEPGLLTWWSSRGRYSVRDTPDRGTSPERAYATNPPNRGTRHSPSRG
jgi:hypothetical protein